MEAFDTIELERNPELSQKYQLSKITGKENNYSIGSCFFGHKWTKWETFNAEFRTYAGNKYTDLRQKRCCIKCNKLQIKKYYEKN